MHGRPDHPRSPAARQGCETCHGPGSTHVEDPEVPGMIRAFAKEPPRDANETCLTCHSRGTHALWEGSVHDSRNLSCVTCHSVHAFKSEKAQLKTAREMDTCATCHRDKVAKVDRSGHMPVREGKMQCSTCHNPHGSTNVKLLRKGDSIAEVCTSCHADKRGPYLWEHAPTRDGCTTCHDPHGSSNERMLVTKPPILCQRCHVATRHPSTIYDGALIGSAPTPERAHLRAVVRDLPLEDSRLESPERPALHPVRGSIMRMSVVLAIGLLTLIPVAAGRRGLPRRVRSQALHRSPSTSRLRRPRCAAASGRGDGQHRMGRVHRLRRARHERRRRRGTLRAVSRSRRRPVPRKRSRAPRSEGMVLRLRGRSRRPPRSATWPATAVEPGRFKASVSLGSDPDAPEPHDADAVFTESAPACSPIDDALQAQVQATPSAIAPVFGQFGRQFETKTRRHIADGAMEYLATDALTFTTNVRRTDREGHDPVRRQLRPQQPRRDAGTDPAHADRRRRRRGVRARPGPAAGGLHRLVVPQRRDLGHLRQSVPRDRHRRDAVARPSDAGAEQFVHRRQRHGVGQAAASLARHGVRVGGHAQGRRRSARAADHQFGQHHRTARPPDRERRGADVVGEPAVHLPADAVR